MQVLSLSVERIGYIAHANAWTVTYTRYLTRSWQAERLFYVNNIETKCQDGNVGVNPIFTRNSLTV